MFTAFFSSNELKEQYDISFSYRYNERYAEGLKQKTRADLDIYPLNFPDIYDFSLLPSNIPLIIRRIYFFAARIFLTFPLLLIEIWKFYRLMKEIRPNVVHINNGGYPAALSCRAAAIGSKLAGVCVTVMVINNMAVEYNNIFRWLDYPIDRRVVQAVDKFVTGSNAAAEKLKKVLNLNDEKITSINNGISSLPANKSRAAVLESLDLANFDGVIFGIVGLLIPRKGHRLLFEAATNLVKRPDVPAIKIVIVGDGPLREDLEAFSRENNLLETCIFVGQRNDVMNYMSVFDVVVLSSIENEDFPFVILEGMSHGKPIIASKVAGTIEQVDHNNTGILVRPGDVEELTDAMYLLSKSNELRRQMGINGYQYFLNRFTSEISVAKYLSLYSFNNKLNNQ